MPLCPNCRTKVSEDAQFCHKCGRPLAVEPAVKRKSKRELAAIIIGCIIGCIIAIILIITIDCQKPMYTLCISVNPLEAGSVSPSGGTYKSGVEVTLTASPASGYTFDYWCGSASGTTSNITITMDSDKCLTANFKAIQTYSLTININPSGAGSVFPSDGEYEYGVQVTLIANPYSGYSFDHWSGSAVDTTSNTTIIMDSDKSLTANFIINTPIHATLDFFGIKDNHWDALCPPLNKIQLYVVADDGETTWKFNYPYDREGITMDYFQLEDLSQQTIFQTASVGDHLTISVLAYSCIDEETTLRVARALLEFEPSLGTLLDFYKGLPRSKRLIGWYEYTWLPRDEWGAEQAKYEAEGTDDLRLWFRIWSNKEPEPIPTPIFIPEVRIKNVELPTDAKPGSTTYPITLSLVNNEELDIPIKWEAESSMTGKFDEGVITIPKNSMPLDIIESYLWQAGERTITYTIYCYWNNTILDTWSAILNVTP